MIDSFRQTLGRQVLEAHILYFRENFGRVASQWKQDRTRVTEVDLTISRDILAALSNALPEDLAVSEESPLPGGDVMSDHEYLWVLDPVDGTNNYACGLPSCAISLGLLQKGEPFYGWIYDHGLDTVFHGGPGAGVYQGDAPVQRVKQASTPGQRLVAVHFPLPTEDQVRLAPVLSQMKIRSLGSAALNLLYVALGRMDGVIEQGIKVWDIAAAAAIARECGLALHFKGEDVFPLKEMAQVSKPFGYVAGDADLVPLMLGVEE